MGEVARCPFIPSHNMYQLLVGMEPYEYATDSDVSDADSFEFRSNNTLLRDSAESDDGARAGALSSGPAVYHGVVDAPSGVSAGCPAEGGPWAVAGRGGVLCGGLHAPRSPKQCPLDTVHAPVRRAAVRAPVLGARAVRRGCRGSGRGVPANEGDMSVAAARTAQLRRALQTKSRACRWISQNVDGLTAAKYAELLAYDRQAKVVMIQETKAFTLAHLDSDQWHLFWEAAEEGPNGGASGGTAIAVRKEHGMVPYEVVPTPFGGNMLAVKRGAKGSAAVVFASLYRPPAESGQAAVVQWVRAVAAWSQHQRRQGNVVVWAGDVNLDFKNPHVAVTADVRAEIETSMGLCGMTILSRLGRWAAVDTRVPHGAAQHGGPAQLDWVVAHDRAVNLRRARVLKVARLKVPVPAVGPSGVDGSAWLSDHFAIVGRVDVTAEWRRPRMPFGSAWKVGAFLGSEAAQQEFAERVRAKPELQCALDDLCAVGAGAPAAELSAAYQAIVDAHETVADDVVGRAVVRPGSKPWWHAEVASAYKAKQRAHSHWKRACARGEGAEPLASLEVRYKQRRTHFRKLQAEKRHKAMNRLAEDMKRDATGQKAKRLHQAFNRMTATSMGEQGMGAHATLEFPTCSNG
jgi:exonuclease III